MSDITFAELTKTVTALPYEEQIALIDALKKSVDEKENSPYETVPCDRVIKVSDKLIKQNIEAYRELAK